MHEIERMQATDAMLLQVEMKMRIRPMQMFDYLTVVREEAQDSCRRLTYGAKGWLTLPTLIELGYLANWTLPYLSP